MVATAVLGALVGLGLGLRVGDMLGLGVGLKLKITDKIIQLDTSTQLVNGAKRFTL